MGGIIGMTDMNTQTPEETFRAIYRILVQHAGADRSSRAELVFADTFMSNVMHTEYRFCGKLGFGGKFRRNNGRYYIDCYREDENSERLQIIDTVNKLLEAFTYFEPERKKQ